MKKKLFSAILFLLFTSNVLASTYWSNVPDGPRTIQEAIDKLDGKMLILLKVYGSQMEWDSCNI